MMTTALRAALAGFAALALTATCATTAVSATLAELHDKEAALLRAYPQVARRDAKGLTVLGNGHPVAQFRNVNETGCEGNDTCSLWWFINVLRLDDGHGRQSYAEVFHSNGEGWEALLIDDKGNPLVFDDELMPSPDGRYAATGVPAGLTDGHLSIIDWTSPGHRLTATFSRTIACLPLNWQGPDELRVICDHEKTKTQFSLATVRRTGDGIWQLTELGPVDWQTHQFAADPDFTARTETAHAETKAPDSAQTQADNAAYFRRDGYDRLK